MVGCHYQSMDMSLSNLQEIVKDSEAWQAPVLGVTKNWTQLSDQNSKNNNELFTNNTIMNSLFLFFGTHMNTVFFLCTWERDKNQEIYIFSTTIDDVKGCPKQCSIYILMYSCEQLFLSFLVTLQVPMCIFNHSLDVCDSSLQCTLHLSDFC